MRLAPGVLGFAYRRGKEIVIPLIVAECEGAGDVGRFLDGISKNCVIECVLSLRLEGMLVRRNWKRKQVGSDPQDSEWRRS